MRKNKQQFDPRLPQPLVAGGVVIPVVPHYASWMAPYPWWGYAGGWMGTVTNGEPLNNEQTEGATDADGSVV